MKSPRVEWVDYFINMATLASTRATCPVANVGSVFVDPRTNSVLTMGYNGAPRGLAHCGEACENRKMGENIGVCKAVHAEMNAIFNAAHNGVTLLNSHVYNTLSPCVPCAQALIQIGAMRVVFPRIYKNRDGIDLLDEAGVETILWNLM